MIELRKHDCAMRLSLKHFIYVPGLSEQFDTYFKPVMPRKDGELWVVDYSKPTLHRYRSGLEFELASWPEEEEAIEAYFRWQRPGLGETVFDIGAHCGVSTYALSKVVGATGLVVAFEPDPLNFELLVRNIRRHGLKNVAAVRQAISGTGGEIPFNAEGTIGSHLACVSSRATAGSLENVKTQTLAEAFKRWGTPTFCKIDIEGAEIDVIRASRELLRRCTTHFVIDTNHRVNGSLTNFEVEHLFRSCSFETASELVDGTMMTTWAWRRTAPEEKLPAIVDNTLAYTPAD